MEGKYPACIGECAISQRRIIQTSTRAKMQPFATMYGTINLPALQYSKSTNGPSKQTAKQPVIKPTRHPDRRHLWAQRFKNTQPVPWVDLGHRCGGHVSVYTCRYVKVCMESDMHQLACFFTRTQLPMLQLYTPRKEPIKTYSSR